MDANGLVTAVHTGSTTVTAATKDGKFEATAQIQVIFKDVPLSGSYYCKPVYWALKKGITNGYQSASDKGSARYGTFGAEENCTREQMITFLYRFDQL